MVEKKRLIDAIKMAIIKTATRMVCKATEEDGGCGKCECWHGEGALCARKEMQLQAARFWNTELYKVTFDGTNIYEVGRLAMSEKTELRIDSGGIAVDLETDGEKFTLRIGDTLGTEFVANDVWVRKPGRAWECVVRRKKQVGQKTG